MPAPRTDSREILPAWPLTMDCTVAGRSAWQAPRRTIRRQRMSGILRLEEHPGSGVRKNDVGGAGLLAGADGQGAQAIISRRNWSRISRALRSKDASARTGATRSSRYSSGVTGGRPIALNCDSSDWTEARMISPRLTEPRQGDGSEAKSSRRPLAACHRELQGLAKLGKGVQFRRAPLALMSRMLEGLAAPGSRRLSQRRRRSLRIRQAGLRPTRARRRRSRGSARRVRR